MDNRALLRGVVAPRADCIPQPVLVELRGEFVIAGSEEDESQLGDELGRDVAELCPSSREEAAPFGGWCGRESLGVQNTW